MFTRNRLPYYLKAVTGLFFLFLLLRWTWLAFSKNTGEYFYYILDSSGRDSKIKYTGEAYVSIAFTALRILLAAISAFFAYRVFRAVKQDRPLIHKAEQTLFYETGNTIQNNRAYYNNMDKGVKIVFNLLLIILLVAVLYFLQTMPYHYDEAYSYMYFSGRGWLADTTFYPVPNNHIFYNIIASLFLLLPIDPITAIRLPNILVSFITVYYFFKAASLLINSRSALIATVIFCFSFPFIMYSVQARGYAFFMFFSVAMLYSFIRITAGVQTNRYFVIYAVCAVLGLYTIPTFIYVLIPVSTVLFIFYLLNSHQYKIYSFIKTHAAIGLFTFVLYLPLFLANGADVFQKAAKRGVSPIQDKFTFPNIWKHMEDTWGFYASGNNITPLVLLIIAVAILLYMYPERGGNRYVTAMLFVLLISPLPIMILQRTIPFHRTWIYLLIPLAIGLGIAVHMLSSYFKSIGNNLKLVITAAIVITYSFALSRRVQQMYLATNHVDYVVQDYAKYLKEKISYVHTIQRTEDFSFYIAEGLQCAAMLNGNRVKTAVLNDTLEAELRVTIPENNMPVPDNYRLVPVENPYFKVYIRKDL